MRRTLDDARKTGNSDPRYARLYRLTASDREVWAEKKGVRHIAASDPLRRAREIPSPTNGSTNPAASPAMRTPSFSGCGSWKIKGEVLTGSLSWVQF